MACDEFGWVATDRADRFWREYPDKHINWYHLAEKHHMEIIWRRLPFGTRGLRIGRIIILNRSLSEADEITVIRHEMCHYFLHACNMLWWQDRPGGELMLSKYERQARELAELLGP